MNMNISCLHVQNVHRLYNSLTQQFIPLNTNLDHFSMDHHTKVNNSVTHKHAFKCFEEKWWSFLPLHTCQHLNSRKRDKFGRGSRGLPRPPAGFRGSAPIGFPWNWRKKIAERKIALWRAIWGLKLYQNHVILHSLHTWKNTLTRTTAGLTCSRVSKVYI